jgi:hypothetical protein
LQEAAKGRGERRRGRGAQAIRTPLFADLWRSSQVLAGAVLLELKSESLKGSRKMSDQERWLNEVLDILGLPRDTAYRDHARELVEQGASLEQIYGTLQMRMNSKRS